jgi:hypothetical protein
MLFCDPSFWLELYMTSRIKTLVKDTVRRVFPTLSLKVFSIRSRRMIENQTVALGLDKLARDVSRMTGGKVAKGPFTGMKLDYEIFRVHSAPKFLGTYEQELHGAIERAIELAPKYVLNVGCAEGFYAVGLAMRLPEARVFAADADPKALGATLRNAEGNGVGDRVRAIGIVSSGSFHNYLKSEGSLLIMDCEGAEFDLLDPIADPILLRSNIIVEIHPDYGNDTELANKFAKTHQIASIDKASRAIIDLPGGVSNGDLIAAADERRGDQSWLVMEPKDLKAKAMKVQ